MKITIQLGITLLLMLVGFVAMAAVNNSKVIGVYDSYHRASATSINALILAFICAVVFALAFAIARDLRGLKAAPTAVFTAPAAPIQTRNIYRTFAKPVNSSYPRRRVSILFNKLLDSRIRGNDEKRKS